MARRRATTEDIQLDLIEVGPENAKAMKPVIRKYKAAVMERTSWLAEEKKQKVKLLAMVKEAGLQPDNDGVIQFSLNGIVVKITPRDELVQIKTPNEDVPED